MTDETLSKRSDRNISKLSKNASLELMHPSTNLEMAKTPINSSSKQLTCKYTEKY